MTLPSIKQQIWEKAKRSMVNVMIQADKAKVELPLRSIEDAKKLLKSFDKKRKPPFIIPQYVKDRYCQAHREWFRKTTPMAYNDGHYFPPIIPKVNTANGLQRYIVKFLDWSGHYGNRINTTGRQVNGKWIPGTTKRGSSDLIASINGKMICFEVKIGSDKPSEAQLKQQEKVERSGGQYHFIHTAEEFLLVYDKITSLMHDWLGK